MPLKKERKKDKRADVGEMKTRTKNEAKCHRITPGPKYELKTLVGYKNHCVSKYRNPAYTFGRRRMIIEIEKSPGPQYMIKDLKLGGYTFGFAAKRRVIDFGPGPKYKLPDVPRGPSFSIKWRTKSRKISETPGPYYIKPTIDAPAFSIGLRTAVAKPIPSAGYSPYNLEVVKPKAPMYTIAARRPLRMISEGPGPIYALPSFKPTRAFSFGVKHSECAPPYITKCDEQC